MSEILLATNPSNPVIIGSFHKEESKAEPEKDVDFYKSDDEKASQLPRPAGYKMLCAIPEVEKEFESGIIKPEDLIRREETLTTVLFVVKQGPDCYKDKEKFPSGPWCKEGDFVLVRPHAGSRLMIHGREFRIIYDDNVEGTVDDPRGISRK
jgi:co-chaperonin GroES (HSP10)